MRCYLLLLSYYCPNWYLDSTIPVLPVPVVKFNLPSKLIQGDVRVFPEGNLHHLSDQLIQLALQLLDDRQVVCMLSILALKLLQIVINCLVQ